ncbi:MAG: hypothetical protein OEY67_07785 [Gammaproteobacteria bacterium]|nr:hypothetical protein [Gammaproteobacteria bacterium]
MKTFGRRIPSPLSVSEIQSQITIASLTRYCASIHSLIQDGDSEGEIYCIWGQFIVTREVTRNGVRFTLPRCPNGLYWLVEKRGNDLVIEAIVTKDELAPDFAESVEQFVSDWAVGLAAR